MVSYYLKRAFEILRDEGPAEFARRSKDFILWNKLFSRYRRFVVMNKKNQFKNSIYYDVPPHPYKTIQINPNEIEYRIFESIKSPWYRGLGRIKPGNWDSSENWERVENNITVQAIREVYEGEKSWKETKYYDYHLKDAKDTKKYLERGFEDAETFVGKRCTNYDNFFDDIKTNGYKRGHIGPHYTPNSSTVVSDRLEVVVSIDRDGGIYLYDGKHRFGIARVLDLEIPVHVVCRHKQWQNLRDDIYNNGFSDVHDEELRNHPDLQDVIS